MREVLYEMHTGDLMLVIFAPDARTREYTVQIGDYAEIDSFVPRHAFTFDELPIVSRMLSMAYPWIFQHRRSP